MRARIKLAIIISHPIQHFVHFYRALANHPDLDLLVIFGSRAGFEPYFDEDMETDIEWSGNPTSGYEHCFLDRGDKALSSLLADFGPDLIQINGYAQFISLQALLWGRWNRIPVMMAGDGDNVTRRNPVKALFRQAALRLLFPHVARFLTVGNQNERMLKGLGIARSRMSRVPLPIDEPSYRLHSLSRQMHRAQIRELHNIPDDALVGLLVGKLIPRKGVLDPILAYLHLARHGEADQLHLLYCGDGNQRRFLADRTKALGLNVTLAGFVNVDLLPAYYCAADFLIHPAHKDPHPLACTEAAAMGLPLILSDRVGLIGPSDIGQAGRNALVYPCGEAIPLAGAMRQLLENETMRQMMGNASEAIYDAQNLTACVTAMMEAVRKTLRKFEPRAPD